MYHFVTFVCVSVCKSGSACLTNSVHPSVCPSDFSQSVGLSICHLPVSLYLSVCPSFGLFALSILHEC